MRTPTKLAVGAAALFLLGLSVIAIAPAQADQEPQVTICHRTNSNKNPYVRITVDQSAVDGSSNGDHYNQHNEPRVWDPTLKAQHLKWGDIIPPVAGHHSGLNWDAQTSPAFIANNCATPPVPTYDVTLDKVTTGGTAPAADTDFDFDVLCEPAETATAYAIAPQDAPVLVGDDIATDDLCTITETGSHGATGIAFQVTGGNVESTTASSVTFSVTAAVTVVATNSFPDPEPPPTGDVTLDKALSGGGAPAETSDFTFTVACDSGSTTSPATVAPDDGAVTVAEDVLQGDECTITENGVDEQDVTFMVTGGSGVTSDATSVTFTVSSTAVSVVATNDYPEVAGVVITPETPVTPVAAQELPRTGANTGWLTTIGLALVLSGELFRRAGRRVRVAHSS